MWGTMKPQNYTLPEGWLMLNRCAAMTDSGQIDIILTFDFATGTKHLTQVRDGKWATIQSGDAAQASYDNVVSKMPGVVVFA